MESERNENVGDNPSGMNRAESDRIRLSIAYSRGYFIAEKAKNKQRFGFCLENIGKEEI